MQLEVHACVQPRPVVIRSGTRPIFLTLIIMRERMSGDDETIVEVVVEGQLDKDESTEYQRVLDKVRSKPLCIVKYEPCG